MTSSVAVPEPGALSIGTDGIMQGRTGSYDKQLRDMHNVYRDSAAFDAAVAQHGEDFLVYRVEERRRSRAVPLRAGEAVHVPGYWVHRSINVGDAPFVTLFCYAADAGQNYGLIADAGGMAQLVVADGNGGWITRPNADHIGYRMEAY